MPQQSAGTGFGYRQLPSFFLKRLTHSNLKLLFHAHIILPDEEPRSKRQSTLHAWGVFLLFPMSHSSFRQIYFSTSSGRRLTNAFPESMLRDVSQLALFGLESPIWSVSDLNRHIRLLLESDYRLQDLWVAGEVSNLSHPASGHMYFTLKDNAASLRCVMWRSDIIHQTHIPQNGESIEVHGHISVYEIGGLYQLYADAIRPAGEGALFQKLLQIKARLESEGLFDPERKRPLPAWPKRIGVVTSPAAAALQDVINVLRRRYPMVELILSPTPVQGENAPKMIIDALERINRISQPDLILVVRGGGSMEDLWAFNDEAVVRSIAASPAPVVSGIGHETDLILADFAADYRAPTPSAAAEIATPDSAELRLDLKGTLQELKEAYSRCLQTLQACLETQLTSLKSASPQIQIINAHQHVDSLLQRAIVAIRHDLVLREAAVQAMTHTLNAVSPSAVLARGFAIVTHQHDGSIIRSVRQTAPGDSLQIRVSDGEFGVEVMPGEKGGEIPSNPNAP